MSQPVEGDHCLDFGLPSSISSRSSLLSAASMRSNGQCQTFQPADACSEDRRPALSPEENPSPQSLGASLPARSAELWGMHTSPRSGDPRKQTRLRPPNPVVRWCNQRFPLRKSHRIGFSRSHSQSKMLSPNLLVQRTSLCSRLSLRDRLLPASSGAPCRVLAPQHSSSYSASS